MNRLGFSKGIDVSLVYKGDRSYYKGCDFITVSDWIQVAAVSISSVISVISVIIAVKSLQTTKKSIEDANKPYIACYIEMVEVGHFQKYLIIKNCGRTPATILDIQFDKLIKGLGREGKIDSLKGSVIAPNQKMITALNVKEKSNFSVTITYQNMQNKIVNHTYQLNSGFSSDLLYKTSSSTNLSDDTNAFRNMLHQYTKRNL